MAVYGSRSIFSLLNAYFLAMIPLAIAIAALLCSEKSAYYGETLFYAILVNLAIIPIIYLFWYTKEDTEIPFQAICLTYGLFTFIAFIISFFVIFYGIAQYGLERIHEPCNIVSSTAKIQIGNGMEIYQILSVEFSYDGENMLGAACYSSLAEDGVSTTYPPSRFIYRGDTFNSYKLPKKRLIEEDDGEVNVKGSIDLEKLNNQSEEYKNKTNLRMLMIQQSIYDSKEYNQSSVKVASWLCSSQDYQSLSSKQQNCYVTFLGDKVKAKKNAKERADLVNIDSFPLITFTRVPFPNSYLLYLFVFALVPVFRSLMAITIIFEKSVFEYFSTRISNSCYSLINWFKEKLKTRKTVQIQPSRQPEIELFQEKAEVASTVPSINANERQDCLNQPHQYPVRILEGKATQQGFLFNEEQDSPFQQQTALPIMKKSISITNEVSNNLEVKQVKRKRKYSI